MAAVASGTVPELSCYTTNLVVYLDRGAPGAAARRLADAVRLAVRTDLPDGLLAFSHHTRFDTTAAGAGGWELAYRGSADWRDTRARLAEEIAAYGSVLAVGNTRLMPWSPQFGRATVPHWCLLEGLEDGRWRLTDHFSALLPEGEHRPHAARLTDAGLRAVLTPVRDLPPAVALRDVHALGVPVPLPPPGHYRWLVRQERTARAPAPGTSLREPPGPGTWLTDQAEVLRYLAERLSADVRALTAHADDLWAASRHLRHRAAALSTAGIVPEDPSADRGWAELPRALRFAALSAARGRARPDVVARAFGNLIEATTCRAVSHP
jgi:hypothetical protein